MRDEHDALSRKAGRFKSWLAAVSRRRLRRLRHGAFLMACSSPSATLEQRCAVAVAVLDDIHGRDPDADRFFTQSAEDAEREGQFFHVPDFRHADQIGEPPDPALLRVFRDETPATAHVQCPAVSRRLDALGWRYGVRVAYFRADAEGEGLPGSLPSTDFAVPIVLEDEAIALVTSGNALIGTSSLLHYRRNGDAWLRVGSLREPYEF